MKSIILLIILVMPVVVVPGQESDISTSALVKMHGMYKGKIQDFDADLTAMVQKVNEVNRIIFPGEGCCDIIVQNTAFVMCNGNDATGRFERFNLPFLTIQRAITAAGPFGVQGNHCIIVYPGVYAESIILEENTRIFFHPGADLVGDIIMANGCHVHFSNGCTVTGDITDNGVNIIADITGDLVHEGEILVTGSGTVLTIYGKQIFKVNITDGTFNCYADLIKTDVNSTIVATGTANVNIYNLVAKSAAYLNSIIDFSGNDINIYNVDFVSASGIPVSSAIMFNGTSGTIWNSKIVSTTAAIIVTGSGTFTAINNYLESTVLNAVSWLNVTTAKIILRRNYITVINNAGNMDCIGIKSTQFLVLEQNALIAAGTGTSVIADAEVNIKSLIGNGSNKAVDASITETIGVIFVDVNYE